MITDDILLMYHLNDGLDGAEREAITTLLADDATLRARLAAIALDLGELGELGITTNKASMPDDTQRRWHAALERAAAASRDATPQRDIGKASFLRGWKPLAVFAASTLVVLAGVRGWMSTQHSPLPPAEAPTAATTQVAAENIRFERSVRLYLGEARRQVEGLSELPAGERAEVVNLVLAHNRLYIAAAERASSPVVARSLRALNPVLESLDTSGSNPTALEGDIAQVEFEMKVIQARLAQRAPANERAGERSSRLIAL